MPNSNPVIATNQTVDIVSTEAFPYLDMEMFWNSQQLQFRVHLKENQKLQYLNKTSMHTNACIKAIPEGVYNRLGSLTTLTSNNKNKLVSEVYPTHYQKLQQANLIDGTPPTLEDIHNLAQQKSSPLEQAKKKNRDDTRLRNIWVCIGYSRALTTPVHKIINNLKGQLGLDWVRVSMSYHRFPNLREIFQQDLTTKLNADVISKDFETRECNCRPDPSGVRKCGYNNICRTSLVVYQAQCNNTGRVYIGSTHQHLKTRAQQHHRDAIRFHKSKGKKKSTAFAEHFGTVFLNFQELTPRLLQNSITYSILWKGNPLSTVKTFATPHCKLCTKEKLEILKRARYKPRSLINRKRDLHEPCKHNPKFHRYYDEEDSTDETRDSRKGPAKSNHRVFACV